MRKMILAAAAMLAVGTASADLVATSGGNELRLMNSPCVHGGILGLLKEEYRPLFKKAQADVGGKMYFACWTDTGEGVYYVVFENGRGVIYPITTFIEERGV